MSVYSTESNTTEKFQFYKNNEINNWWKAQSYCREQHTDLISGLHQLERNELKGMIQNDERYFIGLFRDTWRWSDGSGFSFRHWDPQDHETNFNQNENQCAMTQLNDNGRWKIDKCSENKSFFCYEGKMFFYQ